ncbi:DUF4124 domain-containing protein [Oleiagrimonas sp. C23AA]|uniref:DUF4124 domain-containing protein n=1 Tax=Oleiagrimonas sp. C23AA TaxID=2719047 RepID=UPI0014233A6F|nr:DUF4124 domain-containing protein [Oleiagrimonas sp. C23AA]NII12016.1 DUF4124 domain-containing protein [Oleiagrimonas sp. C23AA]
MKRIPTLLLPLLVLALPLAAQAQVYKWTDAKGTVHYSDAPPPQGTQFDKLHTRENARTTPTPEDQAPTDQAHSPKPSERTAGTGAMANTPKNRDSFCTQTKQNMALLSGDQKLSIHGDNGQLNQLSDQQRRQQLATAQHDYKEHCQP